MATDAGEDASHKDATADGATDATLSDGTAEGQPGDAAPDTGAAEALDAGQGDADATSTADAEATTGAVDAQGESAPATEAGDAADIGDTGTGDAATADAAVAADVALPCEMDETFVFVDGTMGVDDDQHGSSVAAPFKTVTYALAHSTCQIFVSGGTYSAATGETLPFVLTGEQSLECTPQQTIFSGQGPYMSTRATVVFSGTGNYMSECTIIGDDPMGYCALVESTGTALVHSIEYLWASHCGLAAIRVDGSNVSITNSTLSDNALGILWASTGQTGGMGPNYFSNNGTASGPADISCASPDVGVVGGQNDNDAGPVDCSGCANCPFP